MGISIKWPAKNYPKKKKKSFANGLDAISPLNATGSCAIPKFGRSHAYHSRKPFKKIITPQNSFGKP